MLGLLLVDHGSRRAASNAQLDDMAQRVQRLRPDCLVAASHMEIAEPSIGTGVRSLCGRGADRIVILCYFLSDGRHVSQDVPALVREACEPLGVAWSIGKALGPHDILAALLLERAGVADASRG